MELTQHCKLTILQLEKKNFHKGKVIHRWHTTFAVTSGNGKSHTLQAAEPEETGQECGGTVRLAHRFSGCLIRRGKINLLISPGKWLLRREDKSLAKPL